MRAALPALLVGCLAGAPTVEVAPAEGGVEVRSDRPLHRIELLDAEGLPVAARSVDGATTALLPLALAPGRYTVRADGVERPLVVPDTGPVRVELELPVGQGRRPVADGERVEVTLLGDGAFEGAVVLTAREAAEASLSVGVLARDVRLEAPGERATVRFPLEDESLHAVVEVGPRRTSFAIAPRRLPLDEARRALEVVDLRLPADIDGAVDRSRPPDRITLPAGWWEDLLRATGLGWRPLPDQAPWTHQALTLRNTTEAPLDVLVRSEVRDAAGPAPAFRPLLRESPGLEHVVVALRVPAGGEATASLPVWVDPREVRPGLLTRRIDVLPLGGTAPLHRLERPLVVQRGSSVASAGFLGALLASLAGWALLIARGPRWLATARTSDLVTVALFGALTFVVAAGFQVLGHGVATVLGPFAPFLTGLPDDAFRACLLGTLVLLLPRPGVAALATVTGFLMRGLTFGSFHPADLLYVGSTVLWIEGWLWISGLTRDPGWRRQGRVARWLRLSAGFGLANACATATGLAVAVVLYRLYLAPWYVAAMVALPGFLYVVAGCWLAVGFGDALRRVSP